jgi:signal transduction histidine kinase
LFERKSGGDDARGLGLVIARRFIEQHGGRIDLERLGEAGAAFRVELPADEPAAARF